MLTQYELQKRQNGWLHLSEEDEGEIISMPDCASFRESNVNALVASLLALPTFVHLLILIVQDNGMKNKAFSIFMDGVTVARQPVIYTRFLINSLLGETSNGFDV